MDNIGNIFETPSKSRKTGNWNWIEIPFDEQDEFNTATSKILKTFKHPDGDGKIIVSDSDGDKYILEITQANYDTLSNTIKVFPINCTALN